MEEKFLTIRLSHNRQVKLLFIRPTPTATWICQTTDESLTDMQELFADNIVSPKT